MLKQTTARLLLPVMLFGYGASANVDIRLQLLGAVSQLPANVGQLSHGLIGTTLGGLPIRLSCHTASCAIPAAAVLLSFSGGRRGG